MDNEQERIAFEKAASLARAWHQRSVPTWRSRLVKVFRFHWRYLAYQLSKRQPRIITAQTFWGAPFRCYLPDYFVTWRYGVLGDPSELALTRYLLTLLKPGDVFMDVGANCGFYSLLAVHLVGPVGGVHAFEPTPAVFALLERNALSKQQIKVSQAAVAEKEGKAHLLVDPVFTVVNSLVSSPGRKGSAVEVQTLTLDAYCRSASVIPTFIKIDVEGAEERVIEGARGILAQHEPIVSLEILAENNQAHLRAAVLLAEMGYSSHRIDESGGLQPVKIDADSIKGYVLQRGGFGNFIFKKLRA